MKAVNAVIFPVLETQRLTLRQLTINDKKSIFALRSDPEINKYLGRQAAKTVEDAINFINKINENIENGHALYWAITLTEAKSFVGTICLFDFSSENDSCEIGYELSKAFQGQGLMKEAAEMVINHVFKTLKFNNIVAFSHGDNQQSNKLLSKLHFIRSSESDPENPDLSIFTLTQ